MLWIAIPTRNEASIIRANLERLLAFLRHQFPDAYFHDRRNGRLASNGGSEQRPTDVGGEWHVVVADNASTDTTRSIVREIATTEPHVELLELPEPGKGGAVLAAWKAAATSYQLQARPDSNVGAARPHPPSPPLPVGGGENKKNSFSPSHREGELEGVGDIYIFMDADLATDLRHLPELVSAIRNGADIAIGSRNLPGSRSERGVGRRAISLCYRALLRLLFGLRVSDPPCGFKAVSERVVREIIPQVLDRQWFFDTELLIRAQRADMRIAEIPVEWHEPRRSGSLRKVIRIIVSDLRTMWRLFWEQKAHPRLSPLLTEGEREGVNDIRVI